MKERVKGSRKSARLAGNSGDVVETCRDRVVGTYREADFDVEFEKVDDQLPVFFSVNLDLTLLK